MTFCGSAAGLPQPGCIGIKMNGSAHQVHDDGAGLVARNGSSGHAMIVDEDSDVQMSSIDQEEAVTFDEDVEAATFIPSRLPAKISVQDGSIADMRHGGSRSGLKSFRSVSSRNVLSSIPTTDSISVQVGTRL